MSYVINLFSTGSSFNFYTDFPNEFPAWQGMFFTYNYEVWIGLIVIFPLIICVLKLLKPKLTLRHIYNWVLLPLTGKGEAIDLDDLKSAFLMVGWSLGGTILCLGFSGSLISFLMKPAMEEPMRTWQDLLDNDYTILTPRIMWNDVIYDLTMFDEMVHAVRQIICTKRKKELTFAQYI